MTFRILFRVQPALALILAVGMPAPGQIPYRRAGTSTAGSTPVGDMMRGAAALEVGQGINSLYSAQARSLDANTLMRLSEYQYYYLQRENEARERLMRRKFSRNVIAYKARQKDLRDDPDYQDLLRGDTLNVVLQDLYDPKIHPSTFRLAPVYLPVELVHSLPFQFPNLGGAISRRTLTVDNGNGWPVALNVKELELAKKAYLRAVDAFLERNLKRDLPLDSILAVQRAVDDLRSAVQRRFTVKDDVYNQAMNFVRELENQAKLLKNDVVRRFLADIEKYPGTTVAELVDFMRWYNLRFAPAEPGTPERLRYPSLYEALVSQREKLKEVEKQDQEDASSRRPN